MLKLFHAWGSCSLAPLIALEEAGADYETVVISTRDGDQRRAEYLAINPKGRVPALVTDRGPGDPGLDRPELSGGPPRAYRSLGVRPGPGVQQLPLRDCACGPRP